MLRSSFTLGMNEAGCDEAGRGCIAGPVVAAAVIFDKGYDNPVLNDSKKIPEKKRDEIRFMIENEALSWAVAFVDPEEIDRINILNASFKAMHLALDMLKTNAEFISVDGNRFIPYGNVPFQTIIKGDGKLQNIAAASILAKTHRDEYMRKIHEEFPVYDWIRNKGYPTTTHRDAVLRHGFSPYHRRTFKVTSSQITLF